MSNNTILFAIGRLGYKGRMTGHGFRALAMSNIKEKLGYRHEVVDRQLYTIMVTFELPEGWADEVGEAFRKIEVGASRRGLWG